MYLMSQFPLCPNLYTFVEPENHVTLATERLLSMSQPLISNTRPTFPKKIINLFV